MRYLLLTLFLPALVQAQTYGCYLTKFNNQCGQQKLICSIFYASNYADYGYVIAEMCDLYNKTDLSLAECSGFSSGLANQVLGLQKDLSSCTSLYNSVNTNFAACSNDYGALKNQLNGCNTAYNVLQADSAAKINEHNALVDQYNGLVALYNKQFKKLRTWKRICGKKCR